MTLPDRWLALCARLAPGPHPAGAPDAASLYTILESLYAHPPRAYHNLTHIADCLTTLDSVRASLASPDEAELALWLHDCIYIPARPDNESRSAAIARLFARELALPAPAHDRLESLILATRHTGEPLTGDAALIADIDTSILAAPADRYDQYAALIRAEYSAFPDPDYNRGRAEFLEKLLAQPAIFRTAALSPLEVVARTNVVREITHRRSS